MTNRGFVYLLQEQYHRAEQDFEVSLTLNPFYARAHCLLATAYFHQNNLHQAFHHCNKALAIDPQHYRSHYLLGTLHQCTKNFDSAISCFETYLSYNPKDRWILDQEVRRRLELCEHKNHHVNFVLVSEKMAKSSIVNQFKSMISKKENEDPLINVPLRSL